MIDNIVTKTSSGSIRLDTPAKKSYEVIEVQNGFMVFPWGFRTLRDGFGAGVSDGYVAETIEEVGSILKKLQRV